ncbi:uncharacterized protein LOC106159121 isoform X2 [Lingula anatina]|nr:uncharacterized protein LOC106159121 isoform X2 [Lingula anatina]|eukprot:XP_013390769.1 uncharacterized protein LOC106159121 isoform X2 [Lingula anatina]
MADVDLSLPTLHSNILAAQQRIKRYVRRTPLEYSPVLSHQGQCRVYLKMENEQVTGSMKARGAFNKLSKLLEEDPAVKEQGPITSSSGNHALACTHAMQTLGVQGTIFIPENVSSSKNEKLKLTGVSLLYHGMDCVETEKKGRQTALDKGATYISPYNDLDVIAGQGTIGAEIFEDLPDVDAVLISVGGGGLVSGIAAFMKHVKPEVRIIGCQPSLSKVMFECVKAGRILFEDSGDTLSDGTAGGIEEGSVTFEFCKKYIDEWILVPEEQIERAIYFMMEHHHRIVEGAAGTAIGAFMQEPEKFKDQNVAIISCGANISMDKIKMIINKYH